MKPKHPTIAMCACKSSQVSEIGHCPNGLEGNSYG